MEPGTGIDVQVDVGFGDVRGPHMSSSGRVS